jgi:hypothetical protein
MSSLPLRWQADIDQLRALAASSGGRLGLITVPRAGVPRFVLDLDITTAGSSAYPKDREPRVRLAIDLAPRHPFAPPVATVLSRIYHPHVFASGVVCVGAHWRASDGMDLYVRRVARLLAFDPAQINPGSVAHAAAMAWYQQVRARYPDAFPTDAAALAAFAALVPGTP